MALLFLSFYNIFTVLVMLEKKSYGFSFVEKKIKWSLVIDKKIICARKTLFEVFTVSKMLRLSREPFKEIFILDAYYMYKGVSINNQPIPILMDQDGHDFHALLAHLSTKCSWRAIAVSQCPSSVVRRQQLL